MLASSKVLMTSRFARSVPLLCFSCVLIWAACHGAAAHAAPPSAQTFFQDPTVSNATLSPNGRTLAMVMAGKGVRAGLVVVDLATMTPRVLVRYAEGDVNQVSWLTDKRLMYTQLNLPKTVSRSQSGIYAINLDGSQSQGMLETVVRKRSFAGDSFDAQLRTSSSFSGLFPRTSNAMYVAVCYPDDEQVLGKMDTLSGELRELASPARTFQWLFDDQAKVRLTVSRNGDKESVEFQDDAGDWRTLAAFASSDASAFKPLVYADRKLYVHADKGADRSSLYRYNIGQRAIEDQPLVTSPMYDIEGTAVTDGQHVLGYRYRVDAEETVWFDAAMQATQKEVDALLPDTVNQLSRAYRPETPFILVDAVSPRHPPQVLIYNQATKKLTPIGRALDGIDPAQMGAMEMLHYKARDGMDIPAFVTLPNLALKKNLPTIILAASAPWSRNGLWTWDPAVQFLASRGYAVIQPDTRGAYGFGWIHARAGKKQWGLGMQDDLADGARWAIAQGIADPKRICIAGNGYGGYAALMGMVKDPDLFRCAVSWGGIVDIDLMFQNKWAGIANGSTSMKTLVGDPLVDQAQFSATSPLKNAARITGPVFLAYGAEDVMVPAKHGQLMYAALKRGNPMAEFHLYDEQGQDWSLAGNRADMWSKIDSFLARHLGKGDTH